MGQLGVLNWYVLWKVFSPVTTCASSWPTYPTAMSLSASVVEKEGARTSATATRPAIHAAVATHSPTFFSATNREMTYAPTSASYAYSTSMAWRSITSAATMPTGVVIMCRATFRELVWYARKRTARSA